jgi:hypothetical protein
LLTAIGTLIITGDWNASEWALAITGFATALIVVVIGLFLPEAPAGILVWARAIGAALTPLVSVLIQYVFVPGSTTKAQIATAVVGVLTALLMAYVRNAPDS